MPGKRSQSNRHSLVHSLKTGYVPTQWDGKFATYSEWLAAGRPRPYTYSGPHDEQDLGLQLAVLFVLYLACLLVVRLLAMGGIDLVAKTVHFAGHPLVVTAGFAAGGGVVAGAYLYQSRLVSRLLRGLPKNRHASLSELPQKLLSKHGKGA